MGCTRSRSEYAPRRQRPYQWPDDGIGFDGDTFRDEVFTDHVEERFPFYNEEEDAEDMKKLLATIGKDEKQREP